ncbi:hypothetical protein N665_0116s0065 [Sinapis alba]|nr:hypothetical protein N665_0116s0065 [Sinapis alba]
MDLYNDIFNDQSLQFSPLRLSPSPEPFTSIMEILQDPLVEKTDNVGEETVGLINNSAISDANPSMSVQSPDLIPLPETLTLVQHPPEVDQLLLCSPHRLQENLPNIQSDQPFLFDQNVLDAFQEPAVFAMQQDHQFLYNLHGSVLQGNTNDQLDQKSLFNQNTMNHFQEPNDSAMQDHNFRCNPNGFLQGNANGQLDQQSMFNQNTMNPFQEQNDSTMIGIGQHIEEENSGYAHPVMTQSFELPNHPPEQFSLPLYQNCLVDSHSNIYHQQPPPLVQANREDETIVPRMVTEVSRTCPLQNQTSVTPPLSQIPTSPTRYHQLQLSRLLDLANTKCSTIFFSCLYLYYFCPHFNRNQENVQELVNKPSRSVKYPTLKDYAHLFPSTKAFAPIEFNVLWRQQENSPSRFERNVFGRRQRNDPSGFDHVESSSAAQRRRTVSPKRSVDLTAVDYGEKRLQNKLYDPLYESLGLKIDPHLRVFSPPKKNGLQVGRGAKESQQRQEPDKRPPSTGKKDRS